jgi:dihydrofolate reductase
MRKLNSFMSVSVDGYFARENGDVSFTHQMDPEFQEWVGKNASSGGCLLFGRLTYEMMVKYWPTPLAKEQMPVVAKGMNAAQKYVVSRTLKAASWGNTELLSGELPAAIARLKREAKADITVLGSGSLVAELAEASLLDELLLVVHPIALGTGKKLFLGVKRDLPLKLTESRVFGNGAVFLRYVLG